MDTLTAAPNDASHLFRVLERANQIASTTELDDLLEAMLELIISVCGGSAGTLYLHDKTTNELIFEVVQGSKTNRKLRGQRIPADKGIAGAAFQDGQPIIVEDLQHDPRWFGMVGDTSEQRKLHNSIAFPLLLRGGAIGVVQVFNYQQTPLQVVRLLGTRMASEIEKAILLRNSEQREARLKTLVGTIQTISSTLDRDQVLHHIIGAARDLLNVEASSLFLMDEKTDELVLFISQHVDRTHLPHIRIPASEGIIGHVVTTGETVLCPDVREDQRHFSGVDHVTGFETRSLLAVPLRAPTVVLGQDRGEAESKIIGGLEVVNKLEGMFTEEDAQLLSTLANQTATVLRLARLYAEANELFIDTIKAITTAIDAKDPYTHGHSQRVSDFSVAIAKELNLTPEIIHHIRIGGLLHDVGKIGIPDAILTKPGRLTDKEFKKMKEHPLIGANIMKQVRMLQAELPALAEHHERLDGRGYPLGLRNGQISLVGRVVAVADMFDALTSNRPYRNALSAEETLEILNANRGAHLDGKCVDALAQAYAAGKIRTQKEQEQTEASKRE